MSVAVTLSTLRPWDWSQKLDGGDVGVGQAIELVELIRGEPVVEIRRMAIELLGHELVECGLLLRGAVDDKTHIVELDCWRGLATVELRPRQNREATPQSDARRIIDWAGDARRDVGDLRA